MGTAAGLATCGRTVFASTFAMFASGRAYEQIRNTIAYAKIKCKNCSNSFRNFSWRRWKLTSIS